MQELILSIIPTMLSDLASIIVEFDDDSERKLVNCECCIRHNNGKPLGFNSLFMPNPTLMSDDEKNQDCACRCRQKLRNADNCTIDMLYGILPHETVNLIARYAS